MKKIIPLLLAALACLNPMCSGASVQCSDTVIFNDDVDKGSFSAYYDVDSKGMDHIKILITSNGETTKKILDPITSKQVTVNDSLMMQTYPVLISDSSRVVVSLVWCWTEY